MNNYEKRDLSAFKAKLNNDGYDSATGARRAVGKFQEWSEEDRDKARKLIDAHFGEASTAPKSKKSKAAKKVAAKPKKAAAAAAAPGPKKVDGRSKEARAAKKAAAGSDGAVRTPVVAGKRVRATTGDSVSSGSEGLDLQTKASLMSNVIGTLKEALVAMQSSRDLIKNENLRGNIETEMGTVSRVLGKAVSVLETEVVSPLLKDEKTAEAAPKNGTKPKTLADLVPPDYVPTEEEKRAEARLRQTAPVSLE